MLCLEFRALSVWLAYYHFERLVRVELTYIITATQSLPVVVVSELSPTQAHTPLTIEPD